jgi:hypothetical protein
MLANGRTVCVRAGRTARSSHPQWSSNGRPAVALGGLGERWKEGLFWAVGAASWHRRWPWRCWRGKGGGAGQHRGEVGEMSWCLCRLGPGQTRGTHGRTRRLSEPAHFGPKSETEMGARGRCLGCPVGPSALSAWTRSNTRWSNGSACWRCPKRDRRSVRHEKGEGHQSEHVHLDRHREKMMYEVQGVGDKIRSHQSWNTHVRWIRLGRL